MTVFHNLCRDYHEITAPHLDCARSGHLHTICSVVKKEKISSPRLRLLSQQYLSQVFTQTRSDRAAVPPTTLAASCARQATPVPPASAGFTPANCTSSISVCRFHSLLQITPVPSTSASLSHLQITPVPSHAVVRILDILHGVRARSI